MLRIGIVGLPNAGKSTLFNALLKKQVAKVADYPFTTIEPNVGVITVPDKRLVQIAQVAQIEKTIPATIEFVDIAGLVKNAHQGKGLGNQFLHHIREVEAIVHIVRTFNPEIEPAIAREIINDELKTAGIEKPMLAMENVNHSPTESNQVNAQTGQGVDKLITDAYKLLDLITFYTLRQAQGKPAQIQAWPIKRGATAFQAAGKIHGDFQMGFIRAEIVSFSDFVKHGGWDKAKSAGTLHAEGKDYQMQDGDIVYFRFNV